MTKKKIIIASLVFGSMIPGVLVCAGQLETQVDKAQGVFDKAKAENPIGDSVVVNPMEADTVKHALIKAAVAQNDAKVSNEDEPIPIKAKDKKALSVSAGIGAALLFAGFISGAIPMSLVFLGGCVIVALVGLAAAWARGRGV
ncbi:hypothetical protein ACFL6Y_09890 [Elusimicrobiota bacterium]